MLKELAQEWAGPTPDLQRDDEADGDEVVCLMSQVGHVIRG